MKFNLKKNSLSLLIGVSISTIPLSSVADEAISIINNNNGSPEFVSGSLGSFNQSNAVDTLKNILATQSAFGSAGNEGFNVKRQWTDQLGKTHTDFEQTINGLKVYGTSLILHADTNSANGALSSLNAEGSVYAVSGSLAVDSSSASSFAMSKSTTNSAQAKFAGEQFGNVTSSPELSYVYLDTGETKLAYRMEVTWNNGPGDFGRDFMFFDALTSDLVARHPQVHSAKSWKTHTLNGGGTNSAPGQLLCTNNQSCGNNQAAQRAHDGASWVHDYYMQKHNRDSLDGNGMTLVSSVDLGEENAYWTGSQMIYGQAGNNVDNDFTSDFDVIGHEFTHGVTSNTANLVYQNESGALNEAWSDIFGVTAESFRNGTTTSTWLLGDGLYNQQGKAFRYMNNPTQDGQSKDYYPERYTGTQDNGGVHLNSGIANLAYVLLVDGGSHPRDKTSVTVPSIGMAKAEKIFYRALTTYMSANTQFSGARTATANAANDLYGATEKAAVECAWGAVGVGNTSSCSSTPPPPPSGDTELENGVAVNNISGSNKQQIFYTLEVPAGATNLKFVSSNGSGDADIYAKFGSRPTLTVADCSGNASAQSNETCSISNAQAGTYHVMVEAYSAISGVTLVGSYDSDTTPPPPPPTGNVLENGQAKTNLGASTGSELNYTMEVPAGATDINFTTSGGTGDVDMYVRFGSAPTDSSYDCRPYKSGNAESCNATSTGGTYYVRLKAYSTFSGVSLVGSYTGGTTPPPPPTGNDPISESVNNISVNQGQWGRYTQVLPAGYSTMTISITGGTGDADLYVRQGAQSTSNAYDCRPYKNGNEETCTFNAPAEGTWYIDIYGYSAASGISLTIEAQP